MHTSDCRGKLGHGAATLKYGDVTGKELCFLSFHTSFVSPEAVKRGLIFDKSQVGHVLVFVHIAAGEKLQFLYILKKRVTLI
jgi:hypothetical protein